MKRISKIATTLGVVFAGTAVLAYVKKPSSIYEEHPEEKNPLEGKMVRFVENDQEKENADGVRGHLEAVGIADHVPSFYEKHVKRGLDVVLSFGGLVALSPVLLGISAAIVIDDPGPVLFTQKRIGQNKQYFKLHKFRSMKMSTPHNVPTHMLENPEQYITRVGKFIRAHSLDELPQIWDIFIGNMSVIGPRPGLWNQDLLTAERDKYGVNDIKPGLTGWAQINGRDELEIPVKAQLDGDYKKQLGLKMDLKCFLRSLHVFTKDDSVVEGKWGRRKKHDGQEKIQMSKTIAVLSSHTPSLFWFRTDMMKEFINRGYKVYALGNEEENKWSSKFAGNGIIYKQISVSRNGVNPIEDKKTLDSIKEKLREIQPEKVFTYQAKTVIYGTMAANSLGITEVYPLIAGMGSAFLSNNMKTRLVRSVMTTLYKASMKKCPVVFFQNHDDEQIFRECGIVNKQRVVMIHGSGVNTEKFRELPLPEKPAFLCISRLIRDKGVYEYLEACKMLKQEYPEIRCLLVGPYDTNPSALKPEDIKPFIDLGIEYFGEQVDVRPFLEQCSVFVLPSYREGTPKTNLEAMACGRAVITTDAPGCKETVVDGENGFLIPIRDAEAVYKKMKWFVENPEKAEIMGKKGRVMAEEIFDVKEVNKTICKAMGI